jgi:hypothetical protein
VPSRIIQLRRAVRYLAAGDPDHFESIKQSFESRQVLLLHVLYRWQLRRVLAWNNNKCRPCRVAAARVTGCALQQRFDTLGRRHAEDFDDHVMSKSDDSDRVVSSENFQVSNIISNFVFVSFAAAERLSLCGLVTQLSQEYIRLTVKK